MSRDASDLLDDLAQLFATSSVDEERAYRLITALIEQHGWSQTAIAEDAGIPRQAVYRLLAAHRPELEPYRPMCGNQAAVMEVLVGMTPAQREVLKAEFERTGRPFSQAALRRYKAHFAATGQATLPVPSTKARKAMTASPRHAPRTRIVTWAQQQQADQAFLQSLIKAVARGERELQQRAKGKASK